MTRTYSELIQIPTILGRFEYLSLAGEVGCPTFGSARWQNQGFYTSREWRDVRRHIHIRDDGFDLAHPEFPIAGRPIVHHLEPITEQDIIERSPKLLDPENLVTTAHYTHNAIHYGDASLLPRPIVERRPGDTKEW